MANKPNTASNAPATQPVANTPATGVTAPANAPTVLPAQGVAGVPNVGAPTTGQPFAWCKPTRGGLGLVRIHCAGTNPAVTACGILNVATSRYAQAGYKPLHVAYATNAAGVAGALRATYANNTTQASALCRPCQHASAAFAALAVAALLQRNTNAA